MSVIEKVVKIILIIAAIPIFYWGKDYFGIDSFLTALIYSAWFALVTFFPTLRESSNGDQSKIVFIFSFLIFIVVIVVLFLLCYLDIFDTFVGWILIIILILATTIVLCYLLFLRGGGRNLPSSIRGRGG